MQVSWNNFSKDEWCSAGRGFNDWNVYQHWDYGEVHSRGIGRRVDRVSVVSDDELVAMVQVRVKKLPMAGSGVADVDGGPVCVRGCRVLPEALDALLSGLREKYAENEGLSVSVRPRGLPDTRDVVVSALEKAGFVHNASIRPYHTFIVDLSRSLEDIEASLRQSWRRLLNRARRQNMSTRVERSTEAFSRFEVLYWQMWKKKRFETGVKIDRIRNMQGMMPDKDKIMTVTAFSDGAPVAAHCITTLGDTCVYFLGATGQAARDAGLQPGNLVHWRTIVEAKQRGFRWYDLGGFDDKLSPELARFKAGMSGNKVVYPGQFELHSRRGPSKAYFMAEKAYRSLRGLLQHMGVGR